MQLKVYNKKTITEFVSSDFYKQLEYVPISIHRANSQALNPRAGDNDNILYVLFDEQKLAGYIGVLPDFFYDVNVKQKVGWLSCIWVNNEYSGKNLASKLFKTAVDDWNQNILITNIVPELERIYHKTGVFFDPEYMKGTRLYFRFNFHQILPPKSSFFSKVKSLLQAFDTGLNLISDLRFLLYTAKSEFPFSVEKISSFNSDDIDFIEKVNNNHSARSAADILWIINNPWLIEGESKSRTSSRYFFSDFCKEFRYEMYRLKLFEKTESIVLLKIRDNTITVPYCFCEKGRFKIASEFILNRAIQLRINMLTVFNNDLVTEIVNIKSAHLFRRRIIKIYFVSKKFRKPETLNFQDGDGDCALY